MVITCSLFVLTSYPAFWLMTAWPSLAACIIAVGWLQLVKAGYSGVLPSLLSEQFPVEVRAIGVSFGFSIAVSIFGGLAPLIATWLIVKTGDPLSPSYYLIVHRAAQPRGTDRDPVAPSPPDPAHDGANDGLGPLRVAARN